MEPPTRTISLMSDAFSPASFNAIRHGFDYYGMITVTTDVVRENNQTVVDVVQACAPVMLGLTATQ